MPELDTEPIDDQQIGEPQADEQPEGPDEPDGEDVTQDETASLWDKAMGDLGMDYNELSPEAREKVVLRRLAAQAESTAATEDEGNAEPSTDGSEDQPPPMSDLPRVDLDKFKGQVRDAIENVDGDALADALLQLVRDNDAFTEFVGRALQGQDAAIDAFKTEVQRPSRFQRAVQTVPGATEADISAAGKLLASGDAKDEVNALKLAVFNRQAEQHAATGPSASDQAKRKARAIKADSQSRSATGGDPEERIPTTEHGWADFLRRRERAKAKG